MHVDERRVGEFCILATAAPASAGGFTAGVSVTSCGGKVEDAYAEPLLARGYRFKEARAALHYAFDIGHEHVRQKIPAPPSAVRFGERLEADAAPARLTSA